MASTATRPLWISWGPWSVYFGMAKKMGDIHMVSITPSDFEFSVVRHGTRLLTMRMHVDGEMAEGDVGKIRTVAGWPDQLTVRAIPSSDYSGFTEHAACRTPTKAGIRLDRVWRCSGAAIEFGHLEQDPLDEIPVLEVVSSFAAMVTVDKGTFTELKVIDNLLAPRKE